MVEKISFEEKLEELNKIAQKLETGELSLEQSVKEFEKGMKISKECYKYLDETEKKITELVNTGKTLEEVPYKRLDEK